MSRFDGLMPLHRAIVAAWAASVSAASALGEAAPGVPAIYSSASPESPPMPHVVVGFTTGSGLDTFTDAGASPSVDFHAFAAGPGYDVILPLMATLAGALDDASVGALPAPPGGWPGGRAHRAMNVSVQLVSALADPDGVTMHGVGRLTCDVVPV